MGLQYDNKHYRQQESKQCTGQEDESKLVVTAQSMMQ